MNPSMDFLRWKSMVNTLSKAVAACAPPVTLSFGCKICEEEVQKGDTALSSSPNWCALLVLVVGGVCHCRFSSWNCAPKKVMGCAKGLRSRGSSGEFFEVPPMVRGAWISSMDKPCLLWSHARHVRMAYINTVYSWDDPDPQNDLIMIWEQRPRKIDM